jgi:Zn-dependent peptidase ImmA (M78 family)/transcriptional regulator with XRE-family HTH domain
VPRSIPALVQPALLVWARDSAGLSIEEAATKADLETDTLRQWEEGEERPTVAKLRKLGEIYKRPIAVFFLPEPPKGFDAQREFRRLPGVTPETESAELRLALRTALFRREAARELYDLLGEPIPEARAQLDPNDDPEEVSRGIRELLGVTWGMQLEWPSAYAALNGWRDAVERLGVLVFQTGGIELREMRGTSIPSGPLPVIVVNNVDAPHGRVFTILHEFIHILLASSGHHTSAMEGGRLPEEQLLERASNRFAAAVLLPRREFLEEAARFPEVLRGNDDALRRFANRIKASPEAILRRLLSLQRVSAALYKLKRRAWQEREWFTTSESEGGPPIQVRVVSAVGRSFVSLVLDGYQRSVISSADVSDYLGIQLKYLDRIAGELAAKPDARA